MCGVFGEKFGVQTNKQTRTDEGFQIIKDDDEWVEMERMGKEAAVIR